jgi:hypothetical protein
MKRIVVTLSGIPFGPTYEIDDDTIAIGDLVRVPDSDASFIQEGEVGAVIALDSSYTVPANVPSELDGQANPGPLPGTSPDAADRSFSKIHILYRALATTRTVARLAGPGWPGRPIYIMGPGGKS